MRSVKRKLSNGINMYSINYYSTDKDYAVTAATGRAFNSSTFCLPARSTSFMFIYGSHSNRQCALSLPFLYVYWRGYRKCLRFDPQKCRSYIANREYSISLCPSRFLSHFYWTNIYLISRKAIKWWEKTCAFPDHAFLFDFVSNLLWR